MHEIARVVYVSFTFLSFPRSVGHCLFIPFICFLVLCAVLLAFYLELLCLTFEKVSLPMPVVGSGGMLFFIFGVDARFLSLVYLAKF